MQQARTSLAGALPKPSLFNSLSAEERQFLAQSALQQHFKAYELIFSEGEPCRGLHIIEAGSVKIFGSSTRGREQILAVQGPGDTLGELAALDGGKYPASATASTDTDLLLVRMEELQALLRKHPEIRVELLEIVASRVRPMIGMVGQLCFRTVRQRLAAILIRLARDQGQLTAQGVQFILPSINRDLAAQIGTVPEVISRNLAALQTLGFIRMKGKKVIIDNPEALQSETDR